VRATTSAAVIAEFAHIRARRQGRPVALGDARHVLALLSPLATTTTEDAETGLKLLGRHDGLGTFDANLAALSLRLEAPLASADQDFAAIQELALLDPARDDFLPRVDRQS
jgi:predicted nucleic acid-binding protein